MPLVSSSRKRTKPVRPPNEARLVEIYFAASKVICEKGFQATTLQEIAKEIGLTKAGLYHYIRSKERLLYEIMNYAMDRVDRDVVHPARQIADPAERMTVIATQYASLVLGSPHITIVLNDIGGLTGAQKRHINQRQEAFYHFVRETMLGMQAAKKTPTIDVSVAAMSFFGVYRWLAHWYRPGGRLHQEQLVQEITDLTVRRMLGGGLAPAPASERRPARKRSA